jgi:MFS family permease
MTSFLSRESSIARPGYSRWLVPPAAWAVNMSIGQVYAFSVFKIPLTHLIGVTHSADADWSQPSIAWIFSLAIASLGFSAALFGRWIEREGPRKAIFYAALCFGAGFYVASLGIALHQLWLIYLGYGVIGGIGLGLGYITPVAALIKWFPDRPGLASGIAMVGFGGGAMIGSPLAVKLMQHFHTAADTGVLKTFLVMGTIYLIAMLLGAFLIRVPAPGWTPANWRSPSRNAGLVSANSVSVQSAVRTPQFWLLWIVICFNAIAGFGILEQASPMIQDLFGIGAIAAGGFVGVLSLFNMAGRFLWSAISDYLGRKGTFALFFTLGIAFYWLLPYTGVYHLNSIVAFVFIAGILISIYGGGFSTLPAYAKDIFGSIDVGAIYGRLQTATATAGILGPILVNYSRQHQIAAGVSKAAAYQFVLHGLTGLLVLGFIANLFIAPVASRFWIKHSALVEDGVEVAG